MTGYRVVALDAIAPIPIPGSLAWRPIRGTLGVRAFGVAGFTASEAGQDVVEPHTESGDGRGHEELYLVVRGAARFTLDGEAFDAPAGTLVFVGDPRVHRHGVATAPGTEVLAFGGDPVFVPAGDEWIWRVRALLPDEIERARSVVDDAPDNAGVLYARALIAAAEHDEDGAVAWLARAVERAPALLDEARGEELLARASRALS